MIKNQVQKKQGESLILTLILLIILLIVLLTGGYLLYLNIPGTPQALNPIIQSQQELKTENLSSEVPQFHPNMKFNHNQISYKIDTACSPEQKQRVLDAFQELSNKIGIIDFYSRNNPDIKVSCSKEVKHSIKEDYFVAGEGGAKEIIQTGKYNVITNGTILLYNNQKNKKCSWPNIELHELLHVFGFAHSKNKNSIMYPYLESCNQKLDQSIINKLKDLYSQPNLPDLYFEKVSAIKKGRYLDFNITIKNSGTIKTKNTTLSVSDQDQKIKDFELKEINYGAGITLQIQNLKLKNRNSKKIKLIIDSGDSIKELDEKNNVALLET